MATRTPPLVGQPLFGGVLSTARVYSSKAALASVIRNLGANARCLWEHARGQPAHPDWPACSPRNPRGNLGEDHSGDSYGFGKTLRHTYFHLGFDCGPSSTLTGPIFYAQQAASPATIGRISANFYFYVPACYEGGDYESARFDACGYCSVAAGSTDIDVTLEVDGGDGLTDGGTINLSLASTGWKSGNTTLDVFPGRINFGRLSMTINQNNVATFYLGAASCSQSD